MNAPYFFFLFIYSILSRSFLLHRWKLELHELKIVVQIIVSRAVFWVRVSFVIQEEHCTCGTTVSTITSGLSGLYDFWLNLFFFGVLYFRPLYQYSSAPAFSDTFVAHFICT